MGKSVVIHATAGLAIVLLATVTMTAAQAGSGGPGLATKSEYCSKVNQYHTGCLLTKPNQVNKCGKVVASGLTQAEKSALLKAHNDKRRLVAKGKGAGELDGTEASNMLELVWSNEAAAIAQLWAGQCCKRHDAEISTIKSSKKPIMNGQNMHSTSGDNKRMDVTEAVESWYSEWKNVKSDAIIDKFRDSPDSDKPWGHLTQLVWGLSRTVGCGYVHYLKNGRPRQDVVCNYGPAGNTERQPVYKRGKACSACPAGFKTCRDGLCTAPGMALDAAAEAAGFYKSGLRTFYSTDDEDDTCGLLVPDNEEERLVGDELMVD